MGRPNVELAPGQARSTVTAQPALRRSAIDNLANGGITALRGLLIAVAGQALLTAAGIAALPPKLTLDVTAAPFNAAGNGLVNDRAAIQAAIDLASAQPNGGEVILKENRTFLSGTLELKSRVTLRLAAGSVLLASVNPADYPHPVQMGRFFPESAYAQDHKSFWNYPLIYAGPGTTLVKLLGTGTIRTGEVPGASDNGQLFVSPVGFFRVTDFEVADIKTRRSNSPSVQLHQCSRGKIHGLDIALPAPAKADPDGGGVINANCDGLILEGCQDLDVHHCRIETNNDLIVCWSSWQDPRGRTWWDSTNPQPTRNILVRNNWARLIQAKGPRGFIILSWGGAAPDPRQLAIENVVVRNNTFEASTPLAIEPFHPLTGPVTYSSMRRISFKNNRLFAYDGGSLTYYPGDIIAGMVDVGNIDPAPDHSGSYSGILNPTTETDLFPGLATITLNRARYFTGIFNLGGLRMVVKGRFNSEGFFEGTLPGNSLGALTLTMALDLRNGSGEITGMLAGGPIAVKFAAKHAEFSALYRPAGQWLGSYTMLLPADPTQADATSPQAPGYGTVKISNTGNIRFSGVLGDGSKVSHGARLSKTGTWAFFQSLYSGQGSLSGLLSLDAEPGEAPIGGGLDWFKPGRPTDTLYPAGFSQRSEIIASRYLRPRATRVLQLANQTANALFTISGGNLTPPPQPKFLTVSSNNLVTAVAPTERFKMTIQLASGAFSGTFLEPSTAKLKPFGGVILQSENRGSGLFIGNAQVGTVTIGATN